MDRLQKELRALSPKELEKVGEILAQLESGVVEHLETKKLRGSRYVYRVAVGKLRVIYQVKDNAVMLLAVRRRNEKTYRDI